MSRASYCLLCSSLLLRHIRSGKLYWLCQRCRQEVPVFDAIEITCHLTRENFNPPIPTMRNAHEYAIVTRQGKLWQSEDYFF